MQQVRAAAKEIAIEALRRGGTVSGEDGIGLAKKAYLALQRDAASHRRLLAPAIWVAVAAILVWLTPLQGALEGLGERAEFSVRASLGRSPEVDRGLKVLTFDDHAADGSQGDLTDDDWAVLLAGFKRAQARVVVIDKIFGLPSRPGPGRT